MNSQTITILHFTNSTARAGAEEHILTLLRGLDRRYFRLHLVCDPEITEKMRPDVPGDVELISLRFRAPSHLRAGLQLRRILRERKVDILHSHLFWSSLFASPVGRFSGVPLVIETQHVRELWRKGLKSSFWIDRLAGSCVNRYIAVSEANARYLIGDKHLPATKVTVIRNGSDVRRFDPAYSAPPSLRASLGFGSEDPVLVVVARLEPQKGHGVLLEAVPAIRQEFPGVRVVCVGDGVLKSDLLSKTVALGLQDTVRFVGVQSNVEDWYALAEISVLPSFYEGLPLVAIESLAAGTPVVATAVDGTPEIVVHGKTGLTVAPGDPKALAQAICLLLRSPELRRQFGAAGRKWVLEEFNEEQQVRRTEQLYLQSFDRKAGSCVPAPSSPEVSAPTV